MLREEIQVKSNQVNSVTNMKPIEITGMPRTFVSAPNANVLTAFKIKGDVSIDKLKAALSLTANKHLLLKAQISIDKNNK